MDMQTSLLDRLFETGLLFDMGVEGLYGRSGEFEDVIRRFEALIETFAAGDEAEAISFPPGMNKAHFEGSGYLKSFPQLAGTVHSFCGNELDHMNLLQCLEVGDDWTKGQEATDIVLTPAACYPLYPTVARRGPLPTKGGLFALQSYCFRHEPSNDPARMQLFRMREFVRMGSPEQVVAFRGEWMERGKKLMAKVGLPVEIDVANDPFFGRAGRMMKNNQRDQNLKFELLIPITSAAKPTACMSFNYHQDHFGKTWNLATSDGEVAHTACVDSGNYRPHALHDAERMWPETNCYVDLWIEVLNSFGSAPEAMLGFTLTQDFEGDQFTFFKAPLNDLESLYGIRCTELAIYDRVETHVAAQIERGRLCLVEMDSYFLPDTRGVAYRTEHGKTTIAVNRLDLAGRSLDYFHNGGFFRLQGEDFDGLFHRNDGEDAPPFLPYTEFARFPDTPPPTDRMRNEALRLFGVHFARRPAANPVMAFAKVFPEQVAAIAERPFGFFHQYAFNTLRQLGANFELAASHLDWLMPDGSLGEAATEARRISEVAKSAQFQLARAVARKKFEPLAGVLDPAVEAWDRLFAILARRIG